MATKQIQGRTNQSEPWQPAPVTPSEIEAIQALAAGVANDAQQLAFLRWLEKATAVGELEFRGDSDRASAFAAGKRFVGLQFFTLCKAALPREK